MSSSEQPTHSTALVSRRAVVCLGAVVATLSSCGFSPIYGDGAPAQGLSGRIAVDEIAGKMGFTARKRLTERLGSAPDAGHRLAVAIDVQSDGLAISQTNQITRYNLTGTAAYRIISLSSGGTVEDGTARAFAAYSATASPFATRLAEEDARARLAISLADQIATQVAATASRWLP